MLCLCPIGAGKTVFYSITPNQHQDELKTTDSHSQEKPEFASSFVSKEESIAKDTVKRLPDSYVRQVENCRVLSQEEEYILGRRSIEGDEKARNQLVMHNQRYLVSVVMEYVSKRPELDVDDLIIEANIGLIRAAELFDPSKGYRFISYAKDWVNQAIARYINEESGLIRLPKKQSENLAKIRKAFSEGFTTVEDISRVTHIAEDDVRLLLMRCTPIISLDASTCDEKGEETPLVDTIASDKPEYCSQIEKLVLLDILGQIPEQHREVLVCRYGAFGRPEHTLQELAGRFGVTKERIRQIEKRALEECRKCA